MKKRSSSSSSSNIAVLPPSKPGARCVYRPHPAEATAEVGRVDRVEATLGIDVLDASANVERVVVLLGLLVLVQRLAVAQGPLTLTALAADGLGGRLAGGDGGGGHDVRVLRWVRARAR
jgi:hypothetical protein